MKDENRNRMGDKFEKEMADLFQRIGFATKRNVFTKKKDGRNSEQDVIATKGKLKIVIQCKDYAKFPLESLEEVVQDLIEDGKSLDADKLILAITGHKTLSEDHAKELKKKGVYLWNEEYWRKLQKLDLIDLYEEIGKNLEIKEVLKRVKDEEEQKLKSLYDKIDKIEDKKRKKSILEQLESIEFSDYTKREIQLRKIENEILLEKEKEEKQNIEEKKIFDGLQEEKILEEKELDLVKESMKNLSTSGKELILNKLEGLNLVSNLEKKKVQFEKIKNSILSQKEKEIRTDTEGKIEDVDLRRWFTEIKDLDNDSREEVLNKIQQEADLSEDSKKIINVEKVNNFIDKKKNSFKLSKYFARKKKIFKIAKLSFIIIVSLAFIFLIFSLFNNPKIDSNNITNQTNLSEDSNNVISTNQNFLDFCKIKFGEASQNSKLYNSEYFENYDEAKNYIYELFPEDIEINRNRARFFTEWYLDNAEFPIYILQGSISNSPSLVENGYWVCDKNGIVERG